MGKLSTKEKVMTAAVQLFNAVGYDRTPVRDIASKAGVNAALISYHFGGKQGLLEQLMTSFYEGYIQVIEEASDKQDRLSARECLIDLIHMTLHYQQENVQLARLVHREITFDSILVRELMMTYLMKEKYCFEQIFKAGIKHKEFYPHPVDLLVLELRDLLLMPFLHPQYIREVYHLAPEDIHFKKRYARYLIHWVDEYVCTQESHFKTKKNMIAGA